MEIADLIEKPEDLEEEIFESEELQCTIAEQICRAKTFLEASQTQQLVEPSLKVLAKFGLSWNCSQNLDECSLARARKMFPNARMLGFSLKFTPV